MPDMKTGRGVVLGLSAVALAGSGMFVASAPAGAASAPAQTKASASANRQALPPGCITWRDSAGPGHGNRRHVKCAGTGLGVLVSIDCNTGHAASSWYRPEYNKAECPGYGGREYSWSVSFD